MTHENEGGPAVEKIDVNALDDISAALQALDDGSKPDGGRRERRLNAIAA